jgi:hypothetical protein
MRVFHSRSCFHATSMPRRAAPVQRDAVKLTMPCRKLTVALNNFPCLCLGKNEKGGVKMFNKLVAISLFFCTVFATDLQALSIDGVGVMTRDDTSKPKTGFSLTFPAPSGFFSVTTDGTSPENVGDVIFNANASVSCMTLLDKVSSGANDIIRLVVGGTTTGSALADIPGVGEVSLANNDYVGLIELTVSKATGDVVRTRRGNFPSEFEACSGLSPTGPLPPGFPHGNIQSCSLQDFSRKTYVTCADVVRNFGAWEGPLATDRTLTTGNTLFEE